MANDKWDAMQEIHDIANQHNLCVSIVTVEDVLLLKGKDDDTDPTQAEIDLVRDSWEWQHYGENWADWFEGLDIAEQVES